MPGTNDNEEYTPAGPEDKTFGQAVAEDQELADEAIAESGGNDRAAEQTFDEESNAAQES